VNPTVNKQVFAADGEGRSRALRTALVIGGLLLGIWLAALALGIFGGFAALPVLDLGGADAKEAPVAKTSSTPVPVVQAPAQAVVGNPANTSHQSPSKTNSTLRSGNGQSAAPHGKPAGSGIGTGSGKPIGTPGNGGTNSGTSAGTSSGGNGNGNALGLAK
jgi:hypothetical protein